MTDKHAYLVMCHTNFDQLCILLDLLDDERNDIYLHIDKKSKGYSIPEIKRHAIKSNLFLIKPMHVNWGGDSQIKLEMRLLTEATKLHHKYYHLLSGMDLPLKSQEEIHEFFLQNCGYDYVSLEIDHIHNQTKSYMDRLNLYYPFQNYIQRGAEGILSRLQDKLLRYQRLLKVCRTRNSNIAFQKGPNWFSITHDTASYVIREYKKYHKYFRYTMCADEIFLQTILMNSPRMSTVIDENLRYIDWERGGPYTFREEDYDSLIQSNKLFARKFDSTIDYAIIKRIRDKLLSTNLSSTSAE